MLQTFSEISRLHATGKNDNLLEGAYFQLAVEASEETGNGHTCAIDTSDDDMAALTPILLKSMIKALQTENAFSLEQTYNYYCVKTTFYVGHNNS